MKIVINKCYGGFNISAEALDYIGVPYKREHSFVYPKGEWYKWLGSFKCRTNPKLIEFIEKFGSERASGQCSKLKIVEVPCGINFRIDEYDGMEDIEERDNIDWYVAT